MNQGSVRRDDGRTAFRGLVAASGFVLDVPVIGEAECAARVRALWSPGTEVRTLPDGRWLVRLPEPVDVRAEHAPGLPLVTVHQALAVPGLEVSAADARTAIITVGGVRTSVVWADLPEVPASRLVDVSGLAVRRLSRLDARAPAPEPLLDAGAVGAPDLREAAGVGARSGAAARTADEFSGAAPAGVGRGKARGRSRAVGHGGVPATRRGRALAIGLAAVVALGVAVALIGAIWALATDDPARDAGTPGSGSAVATPSPVELSAIEQGPDGSSSDLWLFGDSVAGFALRLVVIGAICAIVFSVRHGTVRVARHGADEAEGATGASRKVFRRAGSVPERQGAAGRGAPGRASPGRSTGRLRRFANNRLARLVLRSPARGYLRGRHARYVRALTEAFREGRWNDALRDAVSVGGDGPSTGLMRLRVPRRRTGDLRASVRARPSTGMPLPDTSLIEHLKDLYREAARRLEGDRRVDEAAFVYADLLGAPLEAVSLYERYGRWREAAQLAEGRRLAPDLVVRLWWRAGDRSRAVDVACLHGVFATAVNRVARTDPAGANELRAAWVASCQAAGDHLGAVEAAFPNPTLWPAVKADLSDGIAQGGPVAARLTAYLCAIGPEEEARAATGTFLGPDAGASGADLGTFLASMAELPGGEDSFSREVATAAVRELSSASASSGFTGTKLRSIHRTLAQRADPLAAADLAVPSTPETPPATSGPALVRADEFPGAVRLFDAAALPGGLVLLALGEAGVRLVDGSGRTRVHWDVPAHRIVPADHGGTALLVAERGEVCEIVRLDLVSRAVRRWTTLREPVAADSFDGTYLVVHSLDGGLAVVDTTSPTPRVVWRELGGDGSTVVAFARTPESCAALVRGTSPGAFEAWRWSMPGWTLRSRPVVVGAAVARTVSALGAVVSARPRASDFSHIVPVTWEGYALPTVRRELPIDAVGTVAASGAATFVTGTDADAAVVSARVGHSHKEVVQAAFPGNSPAATAPRARHHGDLLTFWAPDGRVLVADARGALVATLRTRP